jgi:hypothetical protein
MRKAFWPLIVVLLLLAGTTPLLAKGFFEVIYAPKVVQDDDFDGLDDASGYGVMFGYDTEIFGTDIFFDVEFGYEVSTHEIDGAPSSDHWFRNHRGLLGVRLKYGGLGYVEPYIGVGLVAYAYYEASDEAAEDTVTYPPDGAPDFEITKNLSGSYFVFGVDFYFSKRGNFVLGVEQRTITYKTEDKDDAGIKLDADVSRLGLKLGVLF